MPIIIENLRYVYSPKTPYEKVALDDVNLTIDDGDFFGIIGHTGSGKSTLISHLNALTKLKQGRIVVDEFDLSKKYNKKHLRARLGMVFQYPEYQLFDETVIKDISFGAKNLGLDKAEAEKRAYEALRLVGLSDDFASRSPFDLSGGQKRRVALAGVLVMQPKILVLDEPTAGLDPRGKKEILQLICDIKSACPTIVMISHNMDEVAQYCNKIAVMANGRVQCVTTPSQLFASGELIRSLGLDMPQTARLAEMLREKGLDIPQGIVKEAELIDAIALAKGGKA